MSADLHELYRKRIDDALAGGTSVQQDAALLDHLRVCPGCQGYLDANIRVIASLGSFSFEVDPMLQARTLRQLRQHGLQQRSPPLPGRRLAWACVLAAVCTVGGSLLDLHVGDAVADLLHVPPPALRG